MTLPVPTGAYPERPRDEHQARATMREHHRRVFGTDPPAEPSPPRAKAGPQTITRGFRPVRLPEHHDGCTSGPERCETTAWDDGRRTVRCLDCLRERTVWLAP